MSRSILLFPWLLLAACSGRVLDVGTSGGQSQAGASSGGPTVGQPSGGASGSGSSGPQATIVGGSGYFTVMSDVTAAGATTGSYTASVVFTSDWVSPDALKAIGACTVNLGYTEPAQDNSGIVGAPRPQAGEVHIDGGNLALVFDPGANGSYPNQQANGPLAWRGGDTITISWIGTGASKGLESGLSHSLKAPAYASLTAASAFAVATPTLSRLNDLTVAWKFDAPPAADDRLVVDLRLGPGAYNVSKRALCAFDPAAGQGVISANVLETLGPGSGSYSVASIHDFSELIDYNWHLSYSLAAHARATDGLAAGPLIIQ